MSLIELFEKGISVSRNDNNISDLSISQHNNSIILNSIKEDCKSSSGDSCITNILKNQFIKEITNKNIINDVINSDEEFFENENSNIYLQNSKISSGINFKNLENINSFSEGEKDPGDTQVFKEAFIDLNNNNDNNKLSYSFSSNDKYNININNINDIPIDGKNNPNKYKKKIFKVVKIRPKEPKVENTLQKKRKPRGKNKGRNNDVDWDNIPVPKEKHFHLDRKKKRIIFQRKYLKMIYSIVDLEYPFDFNELFNLIKEHVGDKTAEKYGNGKSFHIIRINGELIVVTMKEKKIILKGVKKVK